MIFETIKTRGLAALSYLLADPRTAEAVVIDPRRDVDVYLDLARERDVRIAHVVETHVHADFASGAAELARRTGATLHVGPQENVPDGVRVLNDGDVLEVGRLCLRALHTPGHSPEHVCFALSGGGLGAEGEWAVFTGDVLFSGEVGRPDLAAHIPAREGAAQLFASLQRLLAFDDAVEFYPGHGHGSPCGGNIGVRDHGTIGHERRFSALLRHVTGEGADEAAFTAALLAELPAQPTYYARLKKQGPGGSAPWPSGPAPVLAPNTFAALAAQGALVIDAREVEGFAAAHVAGGLSLPLRDQFAVWAGWMVPPDRDLLLIADTADAAREAELQLRRIGLDRVRGVLGGGFRALVEAGHPWTSLGTEGVHRLRGRLAAGEAVQLLDVRRPDEWARGVLPGARRAFLGHLERELPALGLDPEREVVVYCGSGYRSSIAASVLRRASFADVRNLLGSVAAWKAAGFGLVPAAESAAEPAPLPG